MRTITTLTTGKVSHPETTPGRLRGFAIAAPLATNTSEPFAFSVSGSVLGREGPVVTVSLALDGKDLRSLRTWRSSCRSALRHPGA
jgi:hypothetical protein